MSAHATGSVEDTGTPGTGKADAVYAIYGGLRSECVTGIPHGAVVFLQDDRSEVCKHKQKRESTLERRFATVGLLIAG